jgi:hypothetical protein
MKTIPDPPRLSTFKRGGGGSGIPYAAFRRPRSRCLDQRRSCSPALLSCPVLNQCGPSSRHFILPSTFPLLPCVIHLPLLFGPRGLSFFSPSTHYLPRVPSLSTLASYPKASSFLPPSPSTGCLPPWIILCHPSHFSPLLPRTSPTSSLLSYTISSALASMPIPQAIQLFQMAAREVFRIPKCRVGRAVLNPKKQLLKRLRVVRHRLRHNGDVLQ